MKPIYQYHEKHVFIDLSLLENYAKEKENIKSMLVNDLSSCPSKLKGNRDTGWTEDSAAQDASALVEYLSLIPRTHTSHLTTICYSSSWGSDTLFWLHGSFSYKCIVVYLFTLCENVSL